MPDWDANVYLRFADERTQPSIDLAQRIALSGPRRIVDIGCGPGNSTEVLRRRWADASILGLDSSPQMIDAARQRYPQGEWLVADATSWEPAEALDQPFDLIFSNATFQWLANHESLCPRLLRQLRPGGALAVQMPAHFDSPLHREILEVSRDAAWAERLEGARNSLTRHPPAFYHDLLRPLSSRLDLWETTYYHVVEGPEAVLSWFRGTGLRPYLEALASVAERDRFEALLRERYRLSYPRRPDGSVLFPFRRLFFVAYRR